MKKRGKYERVPEPKVETSRYEKMKKRTLLQSYIISLISLCLCATMLMGTTMAWFTDDVIVENNEIYTGILKADLLYNDKSLDGENAPKVFDDDIKWEPDHVEVRTLTVVNAGELAMKYRLTFSQNSTATVAADENAPTFEALTSQFIVYAKQGALEEGETVSFASLTKENSEWKFVGNLYDVLTKEETVFDGQLDSKGEDSKEKTATYSIAVYMHSDAPKELMGQKINFGVKLTAYQLGMPEPDNVTEPEEETPAPVTVKNAEELLAAIANASEGQTINMEAGTYKITQSNVLKITVNGVKLVGAGAENTIIDAGSTSVWEQGALCVDADNVTISELTVISEAYDAIKVTGLNADSDAVKNVVIQKVILKSTTGHGLNLHGVEGATIHAVDVQDKGKCGFSLAEATNVVFTSCNIVKSEKEGAWKYDIGCMYVENDTAYNTPSSFTFDETNTFANGVIYSERPTSASVDTVSYPESSWTKTETDKGWALTLNSQG